MKEAYVMSYYFDEEIGGYVITSSTKIGFYFVLLYLILKNFPFYLSGILEGNGIGLSLIPFTKKTLKKTRKELITSRIIENA